jgi:hypothetical protein
MKEAEGHTAHLDIASTFVELGGVILALALLARIASRIGLTPIPFYLLAGVAVGKGGIVPLHFSEQLLMSVLKSASFCCCSCWGLNTPARSWAPVCGAACVVEYSIWRST